MPIYEYKAAAGDNSCPHCRDGFEVLHLTGNEATICCPRCGQAVRRLLSAARVKINNSNETSRLVDQEISCLEKEGKWSHAAELADQQAARSKDPFLEERAMTNYKKAGYDP